MCSQLWKQYLNDAWLSYKRIINATSSGLISNEYSVTHSNQFIFCDLVILFFPVANWIGHILRRNCLLKQVIEGKIKGEIEVTRRQGRRRKKLLDDLEDRRGYCHLKEEAVDRNMWRDRFG